MHLCLRHPIARPCISLCSSRFIATADFRESGNGLIHDNAPLGSFTSLKCGGTARALAVCTTEAEVIRALEHAHDTSEPCMTLGYGSNVLAFDFDGLMIINRVGHLMEAGLPESKKHEEYVLSVGAGKSLQKLAIESSRMGWSGLEFAAGIPASIGGAVCSNAGAQGQEMSSIVEDVSAIDPETLEISTYRPKEDGWEWGYRTLQTPLKPSSCFTSVSVRLHADKLAKQRLERNLSYRTETQPKLPSAGCIFRNPSTGDGAGVLLERAGLKGVAVGGAAVSLQHANFFVNSGRAATPADFLQLIILARDAVWKQSSVLLELEVKIIQHGRILTSADL